MTEQAANKQAGRQLCLGILAHVDAGKTTLSEAMLYRSGVLRTLGRVDHQNAFLDTDSLERERGITIFSKQAVFRVGETSITLLDTPGHVDFSAEMERTLQVLDCAVLVINAADGVQGHTETLWKLLARYQIPTFLFVNKMDQEGTNRETLLAELRARLDKNCVDFAHANEELMAGDEDFLERIAMCDDALLERYFADMEAEVPFSLSDEELAKLVSARKLFPCWFGAALRMESAEYAEALDEFLDGLARFGRAKAYGADFAARVFKITRDAQGNRLTHMKITGGSLKVRTQLSENEKVNQIRIYSGTRWETVDEAFAGTICAVTGLSETKAGEGLGAEPSGKAPLLVPVLNYQIILPEGCDIHTLYAKLKLLEEEAPELHLVWNRALGELHAHLMGEVQTEVLRELIAERCGVQVSFGVGKILYKETIADTVEGVGHFEPLRHYAEVHLLLEPLPRGSGLVFAADCSEDVLDRNWQRLVLGHLSEREYVGVLCGAPITDMRITLVAGRAHLKHTEGGDFREATVRALRQGLRKAESVLLEPMYQFRIEVPAELCGRAMSDLQRMDGNFAPPQHEGDYAIITGEAAVAAMQDYPKELAAYSRGRGRIALQPAGYAPCKDAEAVIAAAGYDPEADVENPTGSVFCAHGAGFLVPYNEVEQHMHVEAVLKAEQPKDAEESAAGTRAGGKREKSAWKEAGHYIGDKELEEIFVRTFGPIKERSAFAPQGSGKALRAWNGAERAAEEESFARGGALTEQKGNAAASASDTSTKAYSVAKGQNSAQTQHSGKQQAAQRSSTEKRSAAKEAQEEYLLVDGYNIIFAWDELKVLAADNLDGARGRLLDILSNYQGFTKKKVIAVFDAYRVQGHACEELMYHNVFVVYTKEAQTADQYIERLVHEIGHKYRVTVATSDRLEQIIIWGQGGTLLSARGFKEEVERVNQIIRTEHLENQRTEKTRLADYFPKEPR